jgi:aldehyde dehydrogenase (NAD+)
VFVTPAIRAELEQRLCEELNRDNAHGSAQPLGEPVATLIAEAIGNGARAIAGEFTEDNGGPKINGPTVLTDTTAGLRILESAVFAPVMCIVPVKSIEEALQANLGCPYALGAVVFGEDRAAHEIAKRIKAGCVVINDMIAPTADPRIPFGGRGQSGFGVTRGAAGLEEMTQLKAVVHQRSGWLPHLDETTPVDAKLLSAFLGMSHGRGLRRRIRSAWSAVRAATEQQRWKKQQGNWRPKDGT